MARRVIVYLAITLGMALFSAVMIFVFANSLHISCARDAGRNPTCRITTILLGQYPMSSRTIFDVSSVRMESDCDDGCSYRAALVTAGGAAHPVNQVWTDEGIPRRQVEALGAFLSDPAQPTLEYTEPVQWWVVLLIGGLDLAGLVAVAGSFLASSRRG